MNINEKKEIDRAWPATEYFGIDDSGVLHSLGVYDCWDDLEYDQNIDKYNWIWTKKSFTHFLSYGIMLLGDNDG